MRRRGSRWSGRVAGPATWSSSQVSRQRIRYPKPSPSFFALIPLQTLGSPIFVTFNGERRKLMPRPADAELLALDRQVA
jgi:hypothetical protein